MLNYPTDDNWQELKVGDRVVASISIYAGRIGTLVSIDETIGDYTVQYDDGSTMTYDGDMLRRVSVQQGRPVVFEETERFHLRELSADVVAYIDATKAEKSRRARLEDIVREHRDHLMLP